MLRQLNKQLDRMARREAAYDGLIRSMLAEDVLAQGTSADHAAARRATTGSTDHRHLDRVDPAAGIDVVGDVEDLRPAPPDPEATGATPTRSARKPLAPPSTRWPR